MMSLFFKFMDYFGDGSALPKGSLSPFFRSLSQSRLSGSVVAQWKEQVPAPELQWTLPFRQYHFLNPEVYPVTKFASQSTPRIKISRLSYLPAYTFLSKTYVISASEAICVGDLLI